MNIFDFLKSEKKKPYFHLIQRVDRTDADDHKAGDVFPTSKEIGDEIPDHDHEVDILDAAVSINCRLRLLNLVFIILQFSDMSEISRFCSI